ncbi:MAG: hypothetical protein MH204_05705 [Fimbriimonadaceae bacterium]|nr:hypothetical protein [Fimbriimonadaceae bacterium]
MMRVEPLRWAAAVISALPVIAVAGPSLLVNMPVADTMGERTAMYSLYLNGTGNSNSQWLWSHAVGVGVGHGIELAYLNDFRDMHGVWGSYRLLNDPSKPYAVTVGGFDMSNTNRGVFFATGRYDIEAGRLHMAVQQSDKGFVQFGFERALNPNLSLLLEHQSGSAAYTAASLYYKVPQLSGLALQVVAGVPYANSGTTLYNLSAFYTIKF